VISRPFEIMRSRSFVRPNAVADGKHETIQALSEGLALISR
jgi:hypothetical protein